MVKFQKYRLKEIASILISNVDKKSKEGESEVRLCNFTDVYYNWAVTSGMAANFMIASASENQIEKFALHKGQVAITKDSETRHDIGIPCLIADDFQNVILGYYCALITPDSSKLDGTYLNAYLNSAMAKEYFANNATGSGMRYTLSTSTIENFIIYLPNIEEQRKVGKLFSDIDRKIALNREINRNLEAMARQLYDYWFVQLDFPDENGKPYKSSGGNMVWNEKLKREIPEEWVDVMIRNISSIERDSCTPNDFPERIFAHFSIPAFDKYGGYEFECGADIQSDKFIISENNLLISKLNPWTSRVVWCANYPNQIASTEYVVLTTNSTDKGYLYMILKDEKLIKYASKGATGTSNSHKRVNPEFLTAFRLPYNKSVVERFSTVVRNIQRRILTNKDEISSLIKQRDELLPLLMNGQVSIMPTEVNCDLSFLKQIEYPQNKEYMSLFVPSYRSYVEIIL